MEEGSFPVLCGVGVIKISRFHGNESLLFTQIVCICIYFLRIHIFLLLFLGVQGINIRKI